MKRKIKVYLHALQGYGCSEHTLEVDEASIVKETPTSITVREESEEFGFVDVEYFRDINAFIAAENKWFDGFIKEITERHALTLKLANDLKEKV